MSGENGIGWVPATSATLLRLRGIIPRGTTVVPCADEIELLAAIARGRVILSIVEGGGATQALAVRTIRRIRETFPVHPIVAWCDLRTMPSLDLLEIARAGPQELVRHDHDEMRRVFPHIMASAMRRAAGAEITSIVGDAVPPSLRAVFEYAVERGTQELDRDEFAAAFGISRRTLHNRLVNEGFPAPRKFLTWCRLMVASALLDQPGHTLDSVAGQLGFHDGHNLGSTLRRYCGAGVMQLRTGGVLAMVIAAFLARVTAEMSSRNSLDTGLPSLPES